MAVFSVHYAKTNLSKLLVQAAEGEEVIIARGKTPIARLTPVETPKKKRVFGRLKGKISFDDRFFDPLPDDELALWTGEGD